MSLTNLDLQPQVICWTSFGVDGLQIDSGKLDVAIDHLKGGVAHQHSQGERIAAITEKVQGEGVTEAMRMDVLDPSLPGVVGQYLAHSVVCEWPSLFGQEERV